MPGVALADGEGHASGPVEEAAPTIQDDPMAASVPGGEAPADPELPSTQDTEMVALARNNDEQGEGNSLSELPQNEGSDQPSETLTVDPLTPFLGPRVELWLVKYWLVLWACVVLVGCGTGTIIWFEFFTSGSSSSSNAEFLCRCDGAKLVLFNQDAPICATNSKCTDWARASTCEAQSGRGLAEDQSVCSFCEKVRREASFCKMLTKPGVLVWGGFSCSQFICPGTHPVPDDNKYLIQLPDPSHPPRPAAT